jgi:hypothetical protein
MRPAEVSQRWKAGRALYRPASEVINPLDYEVAEIDKRTAKEFVTSNHYSGTFPAARFNYGLYRRGALCGVCVFSHPCKDEVLTSVFPVPAIEAVELGRFVLEENVPGNGETFFLARAFNLIKRRGIVGVVSFSDPVPRTDKDGNVIFPGHIGTIYQAHNGRYLGRSKPQTLRLLPDGKVMSARAISKIRSGDRGHRYSAEILERYGAPQVQTGQDPRAWLDQHLPRITRRLRHSGNHKYAWPLDRRLVKHLQQLSSGCFYPKQRD